MRRPYLWALVLFAPWALACSQATEATSPTAPSASPVTETFASRLGMQGAASRAFTLPEAGDITVTLTSVGPPSDVSVGLGIGIPRADGGNCVLNQSVVTTAGLSPQLTSRADSGAYCVRVFDVGNLTGEVSFSITIVHP